jgi:hypothetical protein
MTSINLIPDDLGLQRLKSENTQPATARAVTAVTPVPAEQADQPHPRPPQQRRTAGEQRKGERRRGERRSKRDPVLLDTRAPQDRRHTRDRRDEEAETQPADHLDLYV